MKTDPFFSVIVPAHNAESYMRKGLDSIREQVFDDYELIVVCDACEDRTEQIAYEYADTVIVTDLGRDGLARNAGIEAARGTWLLFMDDDDWFLHEWVFTQLHEALEKVNIDVMAFSFIWKHIGYTRQYPWDAKFAVWNKAWRREFVGSSRFSDEKNVSDMHFTDEVMSKHPRVTFWDMPMYYYNYLRPGSLTYHLKEEKERGADHERNDSGAIGSGAAGS